MSQLTPMDQATAYQQFFFKNEAGQAFMATIQEIESTHVAKAQDDSNLNELNKSAGIKEVIEHISSVIAQAAGPSQQ